MKSLRELASLLFVWSFLQLTLGGCAASVDVPSMLSQPVDSSLQRHIAEQLSLHRLKIKGNVTVQLGTGNTNSDARKARGPVAAGTSQAQDYSKAGQHGGALATAPGASAGATTRTGLPPWALVVGSFILLLLLLLGLAYRYRAKLFKIPG